MSLDRDPSRINDTFRALQGGAIANVKKPEGPFIQDSDLWVEEFFRTLKFTMVRAPLCLTITAG